MDSQELQDQAANLALDQGRSGWVDLPSPDYREQHPDWNKPSGDTAAAPKPITPGLAEYLSIENWTQRDIPAADRLLGDLVTSTARVFLVGSTGLGKTLVALAMGCGMASGRGFLHWRSHRAARVLYIDGEMPEELIKARAVDALRRLGGLGSGGKLFIFGRDSEESMAKLFPQLPRFEPLNTKAGHTFLNELIDALGGVDVVFLDNVMSLITGDQKDEIPWSETLPLVHSLTAKKIGQVWVDHTGHDRSRQYGSSTKGWRFDAIGLMAALPDDQKVQNEVAFTLSFDAPGKARRRTPDNWRDFETTTIRLANDEWTSEAANKPKHKDINLPAGAMSFYRALLDALAVSDKPGRTTRSAWYAEAVRVGLVDKMDAEDDHKTRSAKQSKFRAYITRIREAGLIGVHNEEITSLR